MSVNSWADVFVSSLQNAWKIFMGFFPELVGAFIVLIVGIFIAWILKIISKKVVDVLRIDDLLRRANVERYFERGGIKMNSGKFVGELVYWFFIFVTVLAMSDILGLWGLSSFLNEVLVYFPNIIVAALILLAAVVIANFLRGLVVASVKSTRLHHAKFLGTLTWWAAFLFGFFAALLQLGVASTMIQAIITGFIAMLTIAGGLAFGLGGKNYAEHLITKMREHTEDR